MKVIVIGAGLGGLSAACHLLGDGHQVEVLERASVPGGRCGVIERGGYRFDPGPTVMTMPELLEAAFTAVKLDMKDFVRLKPVDPMYRAVYHDGTTLRVWHGRERMAQEIHEVCGPKEAEAFHRFVDWLSTLYEIELPHFIDANFDSLLDLLKPLRAAMRLVTHGGFRKLGDVVGSFFDDHRLRRIFSFQAMYAGLAPHEALAVYCIITYMDSVRGVFFPEGGMHAMATGLARAITQAGGRMRYRASVKAVLREGPGGRVSGVELEGGERIACDAVVANPDLPVAYRELVGLEAPAKARTGKYSPSCLLWNAGVRGLPPPEAAHHNIHFGRDWDGAFKAIIDEGRLMPDPSILVTLHSLDAPEMAPPGCTTLYVLEPCPNLDGTVDWKAERQRLQASLKERVGALGYPVDVEVEDFLDPLDWEAQGMERGTPFALAHTFFQSGPFRPNNVDPRVPGLVFTGSSTVPGVGVPTVLISGKLAAQRVRQLETRSAN